MLPSCLKLVILQIELQKIHHFQFPPNRKWSTFSAITKSYCQEECTQSQSLNLTRKDDSAAEFFFWWVKRSRTKILMRVFWRSIEHSGMQISRAGESVAALIRVSPMATSQLNSSDSQEFKPTSVQTIKDSSQCERTECADCKSSRASFLWYLSNF